eukprot:gb/GEZJ01007996.1/.p1 GENE.gb/GEZJ01007996.1/~~gb/GEZJ01007996.1/.p1  ORF type:complete len:107 (+),score=6.72 gb/GEZJ01007996.1/:49-369(+)
MMTINQSSSESVRKYSDRFHSLMARTGRRNDNETLVAVYIQGLNTRLQDLMHVARAATLNMWKRTNQSSISVAITEKTASTVTLSSSRFDRCQTERGTGKKKTDTQ